MDPQITGWQPAVWRACENDDALAVEIKLGIDDHVIILACRKDDDLASVGLSVRYGELPPVETFIEHRETVDQFRAWLGGVGPVRD
jgi:hypothetical protein